MLLKKILKNKTFYFLIACILAFVFFIFIKCNNKNDYIPTMSKPKYSDCIKKDLNGDGNDDLLYIVSKENKYYLEALINDKTYFFNEKRPLNTLGFYYDYAPISINFTDLSRDKLPEIIVQSLDQDSSIQHIFTFVDNEFKDIFCSTNNILGVMNSNNNKTPRYLSCSSTNIIDTLQKNMLIYDTPKNISYENIDVTFLSHTLSFLNDLTEEKFVNYDFISNDYHKKASKHLNMLIDSSSNYKLLDIFFIDIAWDSNSNPICYSFKVRYKRTNSENESSLIETEFSLLLKDNKYIINFINTN